MFDLASYTEIINTLQNHVNDDPSSFWKLAAKSFRKGVLGFKYPEGLGEIEWEDQPRIMQGLLSDSNAKSYFEGFKSQ